MHNVPSPNNTDRGIESELQAKGKVGERVTPKDIEENIKHEHYFTAGDAVFQGPLSAPGVREQYDTLKLLTICVLVLQNGFTVTGESACADPKNFDEAIGRRLARESAINKVWAFMGYELKQRMHIRQAKWGDE